MLNIFNVDNFFVFKNKEDCYHTFKSGFNRIGFFKKILTAIHVKASTPIIVIVKI